ncbi:GtrA family protein [Leuconostoc mesenteroides]|uniref:GtrA family protein n=1 Tax=Leuconostoc mesenteroides TaxID=1245 RepID=UPI000B9D820E|nr:GtrA family protein [Leuconostoc mesenteroides]BAX71511.1 cell wall teichoic acid glycosylation protein GtcA [Leuconostoc mesenteroides]
MIPYVKQYKAIILYILFGILTTIINLVSYTGMIYLYWDVQLSVILSWLIIVLSAYLTNRKWVFNSKATTSVELLREFLAFLSSRVLTLILEMIIIWFGVQLLKQNPLIWKLIDNVVVVIFNYIISKLFVFKRKPVNI